LIVIKTNNKKMKLIKYFVERRKRKVEEAKERKAEVERNVADYHKQQEEIRLTEKNSQKATPLLKSTKFFPGTKSEYEELAGYECEFIPNGGSNQFIKIYYSRIYRYLGGTRHLPYTLVENVPVVGDSLTDLEGLEAIIHFQPVPGAVWGNLGSTSGGGTEYWIGVPIRRKK